MKGKYGRFDMKISDENIREKLAYRNLENRRERKKQGENGESKSMKFELI